jgi:glycosyltransferase involved in cell wall biosynthesis
MYADDYIWEFDKPEITEVFSNINAKKKIMMLNYRRGKVGQIEWTKDWDKYMFLNSTQEQELLSILPNSRTKVLPPCIELDEFFKVQPKFDGNIKIVRHSSQGDVKFAKTDPGIQYEINKMLERSDVEIVMLPGSSFVAPTDKFRKVQRTDKPEVIAQFLASGNLFWYSLPKGYMDMGPRVIIEAMASGLPILADDWGGVVDRMGYAFSGHFGEIDDYGVGYDANGLEYDCGWLCADKESMISVVKNVTLAELADKGRNARERAREFLPEHWIEEIVNDI